MRQAVIFGIAGWAALAAVGGCGGVKSSGGALAPPIGATPQSLAVTSPVSAWTVGDSTQLTATVTYNDGSTKDVTASATWSVTGNGTAPPAAKVNQSGAMNSVGAGLTTVTASYFSMSGTLPVFVDAGLVTAGLAGYNWASVVTQGMGYVTGMVIHPLTPNDIYIRTDVGGAYRYDRTGQYWIPLLDGYGRTQSEVYGIESVVVDPEDVNTVYLAAPLGRTIANGVVSTPAEVLVSHDRGTTWSATGLAPQGLYVGPNDSYRGTTGERLAVDPKQKGVVYFASRKNGLWRTNAANATAPAWSQVTGGLPVEANSPGTTFVLFDGSGGLTASGATKNLYAGVYGNGVWSSVDGGVSWQQISSKANATRAAVGSDGTLFVSFGGDESGTTGGVGRYRGGQWTDVTPMGNGMSYSGVSIDPQTPTTVMVATNANQQIFRSLDQGNTWNAITVGSMGNHPAYYRSGAPSWGNAALVIDPANNSRVWQSNGYGVVETEDITAASTVWNWQMSNLEELVVADVTAPPMSEPGGTAGAGMMTVGEDMVGFRYAGLGTAPPATIASFPYVAEGNGISYCASQPQNAAFVGWMPGTANTAMSGVTSDNGLSWQPIPNTSPGVAGKIAMAADNPKNMVWAPTGASPVYTRDGGNTWQTAMSGGQPLSGSWQLQNLYWTGDVLAPDLVAPGMFYYFNNGSFYISSDGGATWALGNTTWPQSPLYTIAVSIVPNPATAGDVWVTFAPDTNQTWTSPLMHSTNGGKTFAAVSTLASANYVAFGKGATAGTPYLYVHGRLAGATGDGIYKSEDLGQTWAEISDPARMQFGEINALSGDMRTQDLVYVGNGGRGVMYGYGAAASGIAQANGKRLK